MTIDDAEIEKMAVAKGNLFYKETCDSALQYGYEKGFKEGFKDCQKLYEKKLEEMQFRMNKLEVLRIAEANEAYEAGQKEGGYWSKLK